MNVVYEEHALEYNLSAAASVSPLHPVVISKFIDNAQEVDVDAVAHQGKPEHVENAGVHSGDATLVLPPFSLTDADMACLKQIAEKVAAAFEISGPFNMQVILFSLLAHGPFEHAASVLISKTPKWVI